MKGSVVEESCGGNGKRKEEEENGNLYIKRGKC
jgi:hypothetical protein